MSWIRILLSAALFSVWTLPSFAISGTGFTTVLDVVAHKASEKGAPFIVNLVNSEGKVAQSVVMKATEKQILEQFTPSRLSQELQKEVQATSKSGKYTFKAMAAGKILHFPMESFGFFVSLGAIMTYQLMFDYSQNPVAYEQLLQSQIDPVGQLAFLAFGIASGASSGPFTNLILNNKLNPKLAPYIGYGGMSVGMIASNIVHEVGHWPGLKQCAEDLWKMSTRNGKKFQGCDEASKAWNERGGGAGLASEWAPGLVSLIGTTVASGFLQNKLFVPAGSVIKTRIMTNGTIQSAVKVTGQIAAKQVLKATGIELATLFIPGGVVVKGARIAVATVGFIGQMTVFNGVQHAIDPYIVTAYHDLIDGISLDNSQKSLIRELVIAKRQGWTSEKNLAAELESFRKSLAAWRQTNMSDVLQAQSNWEQAIGAFSGLYDKAHMFYSEFIGQIWQKNYGKFKDLYKSGQEVAIIDQTFPMNGITPSNTDTKDLSLWLTSPEKIMAGQKERIQQVTKIFRTADLQKANYPVLLPDEQKKWNDILTALESLDPVRIGKAVDEINCQYGIKNPQSNVSCLNRPITADLRIYLDGLRTGLGKSNPLWLPGQGYLKYYSAYSFKPEEEATLPFPKSFNSMSTKTLAESFIASMVYGPDIEKGESVVAEKNGFKTLFRPPQIRSNLNVPEPTREQIGTRSMSEFYRLADVFSTNTYSYLLNGGIRSSVYGPENQTFEQWWEKYPEKEYLTTWVDYESLYQKNISRLIYRLWQNDDRLNAGPVANGIMTALRQENAMYLMILGEILRDSQKGLPVAAKEMEMISRVTLEPVKPLGTFLRNTDKLDFSYILNIYRRIPGIKPLPNFEWQKSITSGFTATENLLKKIKTQEVKKFDGTKDLLPVSSLNNQELTERMKAIQTLVENTQKTEFANLNPAQTAIANICFKSILRNFQEVTSLGLIANTVSYRERVLNAGGTYNPRCDLKTPAMVFGGVQAVQQAAAGCPVQELK